MSNPTPNELPPHMIACMTPEVRKSLGIQTAEEAQQTFDERSERELQAQCEGWLTLHGYWRMTAENAMELIAPASKKPRGWYGHWQDNKRNPFVPDIIISDHNMTRCLFVELKKPGDTQPDYQPGQLTMIRSGLWYECRSLPALIERVLQWELDCTTERQRN